VPDRSDGRAAGVSVDVVVLGLASVVRPTSVAAVYAFLAARTPGPLLTAYVVAGLALSLTVGIGAVAIVHVAPPPPTVTSTGRDLVNVLFGAVALGLAIYSAFRTPPDTPRVRRERPPSALRQRLSRPTTATAAVAGVATHLPGVFYLAALAAIVGERPGLTSGLLQVGFYNLLWFAIPLAALFSWLWRPDTTRDRAAQVTAAVQAHRKELVVGVFVLVGVYLVIDGVVGLWGS